MRAYTTRVINAGSRGYSVQSLRNPLSGVPRPAAATGVRVQATEALETSTLESGATIQSVDLPVANTSISMYLKAGSRYEDRGTAGASSFLKHLAYRTSADKSALRLVRDLEHVGSSLSVTVSRDCIGYHMTGLRPNSTQDVGLSIMTETLRAVLQPALHEFEVEQVRKLVAHDVSSISAYTELLNLLFAEAYAGTGLARPTVPTLKSVDARTPSDLHRFVSERVSGDNVKIVATGIEHGTLRTAVERVLGKKKDFELRAPYFEIRNKPATAASPVNQQAVFAKNSVLVRQEEEGDSYLLVGFQAPAASNTKEYLAVQLLAEALGSGSASPFLPGTLYRDSVLARSLPSAYATVESASDSSVLCVFAASSELSAQQLNEGAAKALADALVLTEEAFARAKNLLLTRLANTTSAQLIPVIAANNKLATALFTTVSTLTLADVKAVAEKTLKGPKVVVAKGNTGAVRL